MTRHRMLAVDLGGGRGSEPSRRRLRRFLHAWEPGLLALFRPFDEPGDALRGYTPCGGEPGRFLVLRKTDGKEPVAAPEVACARPGRLTLRFPAFLLHALAPAPGADLSRLVAPPAPGDPPALVACDDPEVPGRLLALGWRDPLSERAGSVAGAPAPRLFTDGRTAEAGDTCAILATDGCLGPSRFCPRPAALLEFGEDEYFDELIVNPFATATRRGAPSPAVRALVARGILKDGMSVLDWGCGHGEDVAWLRGRGFDAEGFDPTPALGFARFPRRRFDALLLQRVVNIVALEKERVNLIRQALEFLKPGGLLYLTARSEAEVARAAAAGGWERFSDGHFASRALRRFQKGFTNGSLAALAARAVAGSAAAPFPAPFAHVLVANARPLETGDLARPGRPVTFVRTAQALAQLCRALFAERAFGLDVETTIYEIPRRLCTIQCATAARIWIVDALAFAPEELAPFGRVLAEARVAKVIHNARFETSVFRPFGFVIRNVFDTMVASRMVDGRDPEFGHSLSGVCRRHLGVDVDKTQQTSSWTIRPLTKGQIDYAALDAEVLVELHAKFAGRYDGGALFV